MQVQYSIFEKWDPENCNLKYIQMKRIFLISILCLGTMIIVEGQEQHAQQLLSKALYQEEIDGDLDEAIKTYRLIVEQYPENRKVAAEALLHMGLCYEKLGNKEARQAYQKVIRNYTDQDEMVKEARARLAALGTPGDREENNGLMVRKVWEGPETDMMGEPSPDGKYLSVVDWNTGNLALFEVATGKKRLLTSNGSWGDPNQFAEYSRWSPDGKQIVYDWFNEENPSWIDFYITDLAGSEPRKLWSDPEMEWAQCHDWSPDGEQILACFGKKDHTKHIGLVSVKDGTLRLIKDLGGGKSWPKCMRFSPDGRFVAYDNRPEEDNPALDIYLISSDGSIEATLVEHPSNDYVLGWVPDGSGIIFASDRFGGTKSSFILPVTEAKPDGEPAVVIQNMGPVEPMGFTRDGSFFYGFLQRMNDIYSAELDLKTGKIIGPAEKSIRVFEGFNQTPAYSHDGKFLAYVSRRFPIVKPFGLRWGGNVLCIKSLETGKERELYPDLDLFGYPVWSRDGKSIFLVHWNENDRIDLSQIDVQNGDIILALRHEASIGHFGGHQCSPSGETLYFGLNDRKTGNWDIIARDLESGTDSILFTDKRFFTFSLSPDGQWLALALAGTSVFRLEFLSTETGETRERYTFDVGIQLRGNPAVVWTADGKHLLLSVRDRNADSESYELWRIPADEGEPEKLGLKLDNSFEGLSVHPDGRHISYSTIVRDVSEVWMMENFLPESTAK